MGCRWSRWPRLVLSIGTLVCVGCGSDGALGGADGGGTDVETTDRSATQDVMESDAGVDSPEPDAENSNVCAVETCEPNLECIEFEGEAHCVFEPLRACSPEDPCEDRDGNAITTASDRPSCSTPPRSSHPAYDDGPPLSKVDSTGVERFGCLHVPSDASESLPLVVFLHGGSGNADNVYGATSLRSKADTTNLSGDASRVGYVLLSLQARNVHYPYSTLDDGIHTDSLAWDLSQNLDAENLTRWIEDLTAEGTVDPSRIYLIGWSEGGYFAQLYGFSRPETIAAVAVYSASNPYRRHYQDDMFVDAPRVPSTTLPLLGLSRSCDSVACDAAQRRTLAIRAGEGLVAETSVDDWVRILRDDLENPNVDWTILNDDGTTADSCRTPCTFIDGFRNHLTWPDGVNGAQDREDDILEFFGRHRAG